MNASAAPTLPGMLRDNPRLEQWVRFDTPGRVTVSYVPRNGRKPQQSAALAWLRMVLGLVRVAAIHSWRRVSGACVRA